MSFLRVRFSDGNIFSDDAGRIEFILLRNKIITRKEILVLNLFHFFSFLTTRSITLLLQKNIWYC